MKKVLVVLPTSWDQKQLAACRSGWCDRYEIVFDPIVDAGLRFDFDSIAHAQELIRAYGDIDGVLSSGDYPGATLSSVIASELGLPGSSTRALLASAHKYHSRIEQAAVAPEATPAFDLIDPANLRPPSTGFPCFVKPVKGSFSMFARRVDSADELAQFLAEPAVSEYVDYYLKMFDRLVAHFTNLPHGRGWFIAEELLSGEQVTVEGWVHEGEPEVFGIVDSIMDPTRRSFLRFDYPSALPREVRARMIDIVCRVVRRLELRDGLFNAEMMWDPKTDRVSIIEINPRISGQTADLFLRVDGTSSFEMALDVYTGTRPKVVPRGGRFGCASSHPLRIFEPMEVVRSPSQAEVRAVEERHPEVLVWNECVAGERLVDFSSEDGVSSRYAVINIAGRDPEDRQRKLEQVRAELDWQFSLA
jgi:hypothetical protein